MQHQIQLCSIKIASSFVDTNTSWYRGQCRRDGGFDAKGRFCSSTFVPSYGSCKEEEEEEERKKEKKDRGGA